MSHYRDVIVIGAGPAGLSAASCLAESGLDVLCLDEQGDIGGQIYRNIRGADAARCRLLGEDYTKGGALCDRFLNSGAGYENRALVWKADPDGQVCYSRNGKSRRIQANYIIVATGAMERPVPFTGWTLPGVMGAGAANNLLKEAGLTPDGRVVLCGSGPLLLLEANLLIKEGVELAAILETSPILPPPKVYPKVPRALRRIDFLWKGMGMLNTIRKAKVPHYKGVTKIRAVGDNCVEAVEATCGDEQIRIETSLMLVHFGVVPSSHIFSQMGCTMDWHTEQRYYFPRTDAWGHTSCERIFAAGDGAGVGGAVAAAIKGELAALEVARYLGIIPEYERDELAAPLRLQLRHDHWPRPLVDAVYAPKPGHFLLDPETVVCRCENIRVRDILEAVRQGAREVNEIKIMTRAGMGPCQGRMCGLAMGEIIGAALQMRPDYFGRLNIRPPVKLIPLSEVAAMDLGQDDAAAGNWLLNKK